MAAKILVVDDDPDILAGLTKRLQWLGYETVTAQDGVQALECLERESPCLVLLDLELPKLNGFDVLKRLLAKGEQPPPVIMLTAYGTIGRAVDAIKLGAYDFLAKPFDPDHLGVLIRKALSQEALRREVTYLRTEIESRYATVVAESPVMRHVLETARRASATDVGVLLLGETGTGKELLARMVHSWSPRKAHPFMAVNCAALPENLLENELFGHEKAAFTGAMGMREGKIEAADGGTVFLDEIGDMPLALQGRFLRVLQDKEFHRVGGTRLVRVDVRFIAATNKDLQQSVRAGTFREDLFFRLNVLPITIPPLRERMEDLPALAVSIVSREAGRAGGPAKRLSEEAMQALLRYRWPGNIRELENVLIRALILAPQNVITAEQLNVNQEGPTSDREPPPVPASLPYHEAMEAYSKRLILTALQEAGWNRTKAAALLKLQRTYLTKLLKQRQIPTKPPQG